MDVSGSDILLFGGWTRTSGARFKHEPTEESCDYFMIWSTDTMSWKKGKYIGKPELINKILKFFKLKNVKIINDDILNLEKYSKKFNKFSFIYIDCNVYEPVKKILDTFENMIPKDDHL